MKYLITTIAAVVLVGCGESQSAPAPEAVPTEPLAEAEKPDPPKAKAPDISIHVAARKGNIDVVKQHLAAGTDVDSKNVDGQTPLCRAVQYGKIDVIKLLIEEGADVNTRMNFGDTTLDYANVSGGLGMSYEVQKEVVDLLRKHGGKTSEELKATEPGAEAATSEPPTAEALDISIWDAAFLGNIEAVKQHLADGTNVEEKCDTWGRTPLHYAARFGRKEIAELLLAEGADVSAKNDYLGWTPLHTAAYTGHRAIAELLIAKGAVVNAKDDHDETPLDWSIMGGEPKTADLLRKHGAKTTEELKAEGN